MLEWRQYDGDCDDCGNDIEVLTCSGRDNFAYDGERVRCTGCACKGMLCLDEVKDTWINWDDDDDN